MHHESVASFLATLGPLVFVSQMPDNVGDLLIAAGAKDLVDSLGTEYRTIRIGEVPDQPVTNETEAGNVNLFDLPFASKIIFKQGARRGPPPRGCAGSSDPPSSELTRTVEHVTAAEAGGTLQAVASTTGKQLLHASRDLFRQDRQMTLLPVIGGIAALLAAALVGGAFTGVVAAADLPGAFFFVALLAALMAASFVGIFFQVVVVFAATDQPIPELDLDLATTFAPARRGR